MCFDNVFDMVSIVKQPFHLVIPAILSTGVCLELLACVSACTGASQRFLSTSLLQWQARHERRGWSTGDKWAEHHSQFYDRRDPFYSTQTSTRCG